MRGLCYVHKFEVREFTPDNGKPVLYGTLQLATLDEKGEAGDICHMTGSPDCVWGGRGDYMVELRFQSREGKTAVRVVSIEKVEPF